MRFTGAGDRIGIDRAHQRKVRGRRTRRLTEDKDRLFIPLISADPAVVPEADDRGEHNDNDEMDEDRLDEDGDELQVHRRDGGDDQDHERKNGDGTARLAVHILIKTATSIIGHSTTAAMTPMILPGTCIILILL